MTHRACLMFSLDPAWRDGIKNFLNFSLREHKPTDIYQPILTNGENNVNISGTTKGGTFNSGLSEKNISKRGSLIRILLLKSHDIRKIKQYIIIV
ncbi:hypothetical protein RhiirC2_738421 [Rhizophagus irregularis]|uniref:Uncharacterized protein n=1 Tax=Rhizophagus irregularis TaxID=588596 RepID=A0A2N1NLA2_9GLOM|nr:hypothetical protein RhiirC2_738421 [Rhizophagus irregularis]